MCVWTRGKSEYPDLLFVYYYFYLVVHYRIPSKKHEENSRDDNTPIDNVVLAFNCKPNIQTQNKYELCAQRELKVCVCVRA